MFSPQATSTLRRFFPELVLVAALLALPLSLPACDDSDSGDPILRTTTTTRASAASATTTSTATAKAPASTTWPTVRDLGKAEIVDPDPSTLVESDLYGWASADNVLVVMERGQSRAQAEKVAAQLGGTVVGEIAFMDLYQIRTSGSSAQELEAALEAARTASGVKYAAPNSLQQAEAAIIGKSCSPMHDAAYQAGDNYIPYKMIGVIEAWYILSASGIRPTLQPVHVGLVDTAVYTRSGNGLAPELHFPDAGGTYPEDEVRVRGLMAKDTTDQADPAAGGLSHGTRVVHMIAADRDDGVTGVAATLQDVLTVTCSNTFTETPLPPRIVADLGGLGEEFQTAGFTGSCWREIIREISAGAEIINLSLGEYPQPDEISSLLWAEFLERVHAECPDVLFVASAGNADSALDGFSHAPGGISAPNLITVGALDRTGDRAKFSDWSWTTAEVEQMYEDLELDGTLPRGWTLDDFRNWLDERDRGQVGSNYAVDNGEVTLAVCGTDVLVGRYPDGTPLVGTGTSFAAPQVTAAAALLRAINPGLTAEEIKKILVRTAATETNVSGGRVRIPNEVGGRVMRVDRAVLEVINQMRGADDQLLQGDLMELMTINLTAEKHEFGYLVKATTPRVEDAEGVDMMIIVEGEAEIFGETTHRIYNSLETASWTVSPGKDPVRVRVYRLDNGGCAFLDLPGTGGSSTTSTTAGTATTTAMQGPRWVPVGQPVINASGARLEYRGGGTNPDFFPEERFKGMSTIYKVGATSFSVKDRWQDREYVAWDITLTCNFDAPKAVLIPGKEYELTATFSHGGMANEPTPGARFGYESAALGLRNNDILAYFPWAVDFNGVDSKTWKFTAPPAQPGATIEIHAFWWNTPCCDVTWTYRAE